MSDRERKFRELDKAIEKAASMLHELGTPDDITTELMEVHHWQRRFAAMQLQDCFNALLAAEPATAPASESPIEGKWYSGPRGKPLQIKRPATAHDSDCQCVACKTDYPEAMPDDMPATAGEEQPDKQGEQQCG